MNSKFLALLFIITGLAFSSRAVGEEELEIITWPGAYGIALKQAIVVPFSERTGKNVVVKTYPRDDQIFRFDNFNEHGSVLDLEAGEALKACASGKLVSLRDLRLADAPDQTPATEDFYAMPQGDCSAVSSTFNHVIAFKSDAFSRAPQTIAALFDLKNFPGTRGLRKEPETILVWAALAAGVPHHSVYDVLLTADGAELAFEQLDLIKKHIVWWERMDEPVLWLTTGKVVFSSAFHPLIYQANRQHPQRLVSVTEGQISENNVWVIPVTAKNKEMAKAFIVHATSARPLAAFSSLVPYGPGRRSAFPFVAGEMHRHLPATRDSDLPSIQLDHKWWLEHGEYLKKRFAAWVINTQTHTPVQTKSEEITPSTDE